VKINDLSLYSKYAFRDLIRSYSKILSIIITLLISLFILSTILTIEDSLENELNENSKVLLGGDLEIDYNNREGDSNLIKQIENISTVSQVVEFSTMISTIEKKPNKTSFTRIKAIDQNYPLYGDVIFEPVGSLKKLNEIDNTILVNENIFKNLNLKINDIVKVQNKKFKVIGVVKVLPDIGGAFVFGDFALTGKKTLDKLELNTLGSFLNYEYKIKFDDYKNKDKKINEIKKIFKNNDKVKIQYPENSAGGIKRIIDNFSQFLSLVSISAMLIAGIGIANTLLSFINQKNSSIAVQKAIGINSGNIKTIYYLQLLFSLIFISLVAYGLSFFLVPVVDKYISDGLGLNIEASFSLTNLFIVFVVGLLVIIIFSIPTVNSIDQIKASSLFRNVFQSLQFKYSKLSISLSLLLLTILVSLFASRSSIPTYSLIYFASFFICLAVFFYVSRFIILLLRKNLLNLGISSKIAIKNITQSKSITPITVMSLGLGMTLLLTLAFVGSNFKREIAKSIPEIAPDYFFLGIQNNQKNLFKKIIIDSDKEAVMEIVPMVSAGLVKINGIDPNTYISDSNDSYWVIMNDRRVSWVNTIPKDNPILEGSWWDTSKPNKLQISLDSKVAKDFGVNIGDKFTLRIYGREIEGEVVNFRLVNYQDLSINFAMLLNPQFAENIPHEYLSTIKFKNIKSFNEVNFLDKFPSVSIIKISDYLSKVTDVLNKVFIAVSILSAVTVIIGLVVISSAIIVQGKIKIFQNLVFKILGFSKKEIIMSSIIEFIISFLSIIFFSTIFAVLASKFIIENIFQLKWLFEINIFFYVTIGVGVATLALIIITNFRYLSPKVYPLVRNE
jgi:putative ABC transport system permease protein